MIRTTAPIPTPRWTNGAIDLVATLVAGSMHGCALLWRVVIGSTLKVVLVEGGP